MTPDYSNPMLNWALFTLALWLLPILEERELVSHFGTGYSNYMKKVPRIVPD
jgi:protein-S-isoprenylcysteine O-methyltransferase Ste14